MDCRWLEREKDGHGEVGSTCTCTEREAGACVQSHRLELDYVIISQ